MASSMMKTIRFVTPLRKLHRKRGNDRKSLQQTSVNLVVVQALKALQIIKDTTAPSKIHPEDIPNFLFRWTQEHHRSNEPFNIVWYQVLIKHYDEESVAIEKFLIDMNEMTTFMLLILNNYIDNCDPEYIRSLLDGAVKYFNYDEKLCKLMRDYKKSMYAKQASDFINRVKKAIKSKPLNPDELNIDNIKVRARLEYEDSRRYQMELMLSLAEQELIDKISQQNDIMEHEDKCNSLIMNAYYGYQDELIRKYSKCEKNYLAVEETITHEVQILKTKMQKLKDSYEFYHEEYKQINQKMSLMYRANNARAAKLAQLNGRITSKRHLVPKSSYKRIKLKKIKNSMKPSEVL
ncbi:uncharacterized protein LOC119632413 [Glossina fuscipes]|uniref:Uncharacterized protein LOC119632413 n=1 Tax=Glossina fuscipes TaxID=7396 RepID=A0A8U0W890_9MUSC|nr:uncharacterized protein LOC119632413 [Glossina fuscipes]